MGFPMLTDEQPWQPPFHYDPTTGQVYDANLKRVCTQMPYVADKFNAMVAEALTAYFQEKRLDGPNLRDLKTALENTACRTDGDGEMCWCDNADDGSGHSLRDGLYQQKHALWCKN